MQYDDIGIDIDAEKKVAVVEIQKGPNNFFDVDMINNLADAFSQFDQGDDVRASRRRGS